MSDDENITEQEENEDEVTEEEEAQASFLEDEDEETKDGEKEEESGDSEDEKKSEEDEEEEEQEEEEEKDEDEPSDTKKRLDERLKEVEDEEKPEEEEPPAKDEEKSSDVTVFTKEQVSDHLGILRDGELPGEIIIGDQTINLKEYAKNFPDEFAGIKVTAAVIAQRIAEKALEGKGFLTSEDIDDKINEQNVKIAQMSFDTQVAQTLDDDGNLKHPDYYNIVYGAGKEAFHEWVNQSKKYQKMANSLNPDDGVLLLDYYKEDTAKTKSSAAKAKAKEKKKKHDAINDETGVKKSVKKRPSSQTAKTEEEIKKEEEEAFLEDD